MLEQILVKYDDNKPSYDDIILWSALKYALCMDEGAVTEAVIMTAIRRLHDISDQTLWDALTAVERYLQEAEVDGDKAFVCEWAELRVWLYSEREARMAKRHEDDEG